MKNTILMTVFMIGAAVAQAADQATVQAVLSQGSAGAGTSTGQAFLLVQVNNSSNGAAVSGLTQSDFAVQDQLALPGQSCGFQVSGFVAKSDGAYEFSLTLPRAVSACTWIKGVYLASVKVANVSVAGQTIGNLAIR